MDSDDFRFWAIILGAIGVAFAAVIGSSFVVCHHIERMAELGYEEEPVPGSNCLMWRRRTPPPPKAEPKWDLLTPAQPVTPKDIIEYVTTNVPPSLYDLVSVTQEQLNAWTSVHQTVVCPGAGRSSTGRNRSAATSAWSRTARGRRSDARHGQGILKGEHGKWSS